MQKSFTFIELLITVVIILVTSGLSLAAYREYNENQRLDAAVRKTVDLIDLAHKKTLAGIDRCTVTTTANQLQISANCNAGASLTYNYDKGIILTSKSTASVTFQLLTGNPMAAGSITVKNNVSKQCVDIEISATGSVQFGPHYSTDC